MYTWSAALLMARQQAISTDPPPNTTLLFLMRFLTTQSASCSDLLASSTIMELPPLMRIVTALQFAQSLIASMRSLVVPKCSSSMRPAFPSFSGVISWKRGIMRPPVAIAISSMSVPDTQRTAGRLFWSRRWLASSSKPHWQRAMVAPESFTFFTMSTKYCCSWLWSFLKSSALEMLMLCLVLGFGGSKGQVRMQIFASFITFGIWGWLMSLSMMIPFTRVVSSRLPPVLPLTFLKEKVKNKYKEKGGGDTFKKYQEGRGGGGKW